MTTINTQNVSQTLLDSVNAGDKSELSQAEETENRFLTLLVEQMKNQDPLNPMENAQVTSQMAQLSTVTGIDTLNETMSSMISSVQTGQSYQAASMIGHNVLVPGDSLTQTGAESLFGYEAATDADNVVIEIKDASNEVVKTINMSDVSAGVNAVQWDGVMDDGEQAPHGEYSFSLTGSLAGTEVTLNPLAFAAVTSVSTDSSGVKLNLSNQNSVSTSDIKEIF